ncbi:hypothetical protein L7F22_047614 [Adiantum nelumboides]|nr:hypothetical protein [Adiantum nelumboides]
MITIFNRHIWEKINSISPQLHATPRKMQCLCKSIGSTSSSSAVTSNAYIACRTVGFQRLFSTYGESSATLHTPPPSRKDGEAFCSTEFKPNFLRLGLHPFFTCKVFAATHHSYFPIRGLRSAPKKNALRNPNPSLNSSTHKKMGKVNVSKDSLATTKASSKPAVRGPKSSFTKPKQLETKSPLKPVQAQHKSSSRSAQGKTEFSSNSFQAKTRSSSTRVNPVQAKAKDFSKQVQKKFVVDEQEDSEVEEEFEEDLDDDEEDLSDDVVEDEDEDFDGEEDEDLVDELVEEDADDDQSVGEDDAFIDDMLEEEGEGVEDVMVQCDACGSSIGAVLMQDGHVIAYESKVLRGPEKHMQIYEEELLAVIHVLESWKHYLLGADFTVQTDHQSLRYFLTQAKLLEKHLSWANFLSMFHFQLVHVVGKKNVVADALSRRPHVAAMSIAYQHELDEMQDHFSTDEDFADSYSLKDGYLMFRGKLCVSQLLQKPKRPNVQQPLHAENGAENQPIGAENQPQEVAIDAPQVGEQVDRHRQPVVVMQPAEQPAVFDDLQLGDGGDGGGVKLSQTAWGEVALSIAKEVLEEFGDNFSLYAFKTSYDHSVYVRLDKHSDRYGSPTMVEIESFSSIYNKRLEEAGLDGTIPDNIALEVSSPGAERVVQVPDQLMRFKDLPMLVRYEEAQENESTKTSPVVKDSILQLAAVETELGKSVWKLANVRANRDQAGKGRGLTKKQKEWRLEIPFSSLRLVRLYMDI